MHNPRRSLYAATIAVPARMARLLACAAMLLACVVALVSCTFAGPKHVKVLIVPKFEQDEMTGDFPGEAQLFYERYCPGCEEIELDNMPPTASFYLNEDNGVAILITGSGKQAVSQSLTALLSDDSYDFSDAYIVSVGCGGGNYEYTTFGDVILDTTACDYDLGHHVDSSEIADNGDPTWYQDYSFADYSWKGFDDELVEQVYDMVKDVPLQTTDNALATMRRNFADRPDEELLPSVKLGTVISGDDYWKGEHGHETAKYIAEYYGCPDPYAVTEMEEMAVLNVANAFGMRDRVVSLRVIVNMDVFMDGETPKSLWGTYDDVNEKFGEDNTETLDIFEPGMHNLFDVASVVIDAALEGQLGS